VPGGLPGAILIGVLPTLLLVFSIVRGEREMVLGMSSTTFGLILMALGVAAYGVNYLIRPGGWSTTSETVATST
jgi:hypothetical protein